MKTYINNTFKQIRFAVIQKIWFDKFNIFTHCSLRGFFPKISFKTIYMAPDTKSRTTTNDWYVHAYFITLKVETIFIVTTCTSKALCAALID